MTACMAFQTDTENERDLKAEVLSAMNCIKDLDEFQQITMRGTKHDFSHPAAYRLMCVAPDTVVHNKRHEYEVRPATRTIFNMMWDSHIFKTKEQMQMESLLQRLRQGVPFG